MLDLLGRVYVAFSLIAVSTGLLAAWADGDHLLQSDDPYLIGFILGGVAAVLATIYLAFSQYSLPPVPTHTANTVYFGGLFLWTAFWSATDYNATEGKGIGLAIAGASAVTGIVVWPICRFGLPKVAARTIGLLGAMFIAGYVYVAIQLAQRMH